MVNVVPPEEQEKARAMATRLERLASQYKAVASGVIKPHTKASRGMKRAARLLIRRLVEEWV